MTTQASGTALGTSILTTCRVSNLMPRHREWPRGRDSTATPVSFGQNLLGAAELGGPALPE